MAKNTHRSNPDAHVAQMRRFLVWAKNNLEEAWEQASSERDESPWKLQALRSDEGQATAEAIKAVYLAAMVEAQAKVSATPAGPGRKAAQAFLRVARQRYSEIESALRPRRRRHR